MKPEIKAQLISQANAKGMSVETYLESLIEDSLITHKENPVAPAFTK